MAGVHECPGCHYRFESSQDLEDHEEVCGSACLECLDPGCKGGCI